MAVKRKLSDGSEVDSITNLEKFVQSFPATAEPEPREPKSTTAQNVSGQAGSPTPSAVGAGTTTVAEGVASAPSPAAPPPVVVSPVPDPEFAGLSPDQIIAKVKQERDRARQTQTDLDALRIQQQAEEAARKVFREQQQAPPAQPVARSEDKRWAEVDDAWFTDPPKARAVMRAIQQDELRETLDAERPKIKQEVFSEMSEKDRNEQGRYAFSSSMQELQTLGVPAEQITTDRVTGVYAAITRPPSASSPNPYFSAGGPLNAKVIVAAWRDLYGLPAQATPAAPVTQQAAPQAAAPAPVIAPPPGSSRPAPAATPPGNGRLPSLSAAEKRDIEHLAGSFGYDAEKLMNRRRNRLAAEQEKKS